MNVQAPTIHHTNHTSIMRKSLENVQVEKCLLLFCSKTTRGNWHIYLRNYWQNYLCLTSLNKHVQKLNIGKHSKHNHKFNNSLDGAPSLAQGAQKLSSEATSARSRAPSQLRGQAGLRAPFRPAQQPPEKLRGPYLSSRNLILASWASVQLKGVP